MDNAVYYIWLQTVCGICSGVYLQLFTRFASAKEIYDCEDFSFLSPKFSCTERLVKKDLSLAFEIYKKCKNNDIYIMTYHDRLFPDSLRLLQSPPAVLYCKGEVRDLNGEVCVAVVGTRRLTDFGGAVAEVICQKRPVKMRILGLPDEPLYNGESKYVFEHYGLTATGIAKVAKELIR